jgi:hypothetical protein
LIKEVSGNNMQSILNTPKTFGKDTDEAKALFASPNGKGSYWLLLQNSQHLGPRTLESISVFSTLEANGRGNDKDGGGPWAWMALKFKTAPEPESEGPPAQA